MEGKPVTIYDIAKKAGVSASSVSRVVNNKPGVNPETREKIKKLLKEYNYVANEAARGLVTKSNRMVGILISDIRSIHLTEGVWEITRILSSKGYCTLILNTGNTDEGRAEGVRTMEERSVDALILMGSMFENPRVQEAIVQYMPGKPVFIMNGYLNLPNVQGVVSNERSGIHSCVDLLAQKGRRRLCYISDNMVRISSRSKKLGFQEGIRANFGDDMPYYIYENVSADMTGGFGAMMKALHEHPDIDGVICSMDILACGALQAIRESGRVVPRDISVIGVDNSEFAETCYPRLTSLDNMIIESSVEISTRVISNLEGSPSSVRKIMLFTRIMERDTT
jgi:LacI family transcriptional regulator